MNTTISRRKVWLAASVWALFTALSLTHASAQSTYVIYGRAWVEQESTVDVQSSSTAAIPGTTPNDPDPESDGNPPVPLPGVSIDVFDVATNNLLGSGRANRDGFYSVQYTRPAVANHDVRARVHFSFEDGGTELVGEVGPTTVNQQLFPHEFTIATEAPFNAGSERFSAAGEFVFLQVGHIEMHNIYDQQQDPADSSLWGLTKPPAAGHAVGPHWAFGGGIDLYGLFEETTPARYYRINYSGPDSGSITTPLWKTNYVLTSSGVAVHRRLLGPKNIGPLTNVYELDEFLDGLPTIDDPTQTYSTFWTRQSLRGVLPSATLANGKYTLSVEAWDGAFGPVPAATNNYSTLNLHLVNTPPMAKIHNLQYLDGSIVLSDANPCQSVLLNKVSASTDDDNLQFQLTATHSSNYPDTTDPNQAGLHRWQLFAWHGHNTPDGVIASGGYPFSSPPPNPSIFVTPPSITYQSCAYRFRLRVWPRITNGYHTVYIREDNWYAGIQEHTMP